MLYATEIMGSQAVDAQGNYVGRVREFFVEPADQPNRVSHFLISRGRFAPSWRGMIRCPRSSRGGFS